MALAPAPGAVAPGARSVPVPSDLLTDRRLSAQARVLYGTLSLVPGHHNNRGLFTFPQLAAISGAGPNTIKRAISELAETGWLHIARKNRLAPVHFTCLNPVQAQAEAEVAGARYRLEQARFLGEALMREYLSLLIESQKFEDDANPGFLVNPLTNERMQFDRFYPPSVAFEYNGPQHYGPTEQFTADEAAAQRARDFMKMGICQTEGITLVIVHREDLSLEGMRRKVGNLLPLRDVGGVHDLITFLDKVARRYRTTQRPS